MLENVLLKNIKNFGHNVLKLFKILENFSIITSKSVLDIWHK